MSECPVHGPRCTDYAAGRQAFGVVKELAAQHDELHVLRARIADLLEFAASMERTGDPIWPHEIRQALGVEP